MVASRGAFTVDLESPGPHAVLPVVPLAADHLAPLRAGVGSTALVILDQ